jgi:8-oxo-dGTP diphosphatase
VINYVLGFAFDTDCRVALIQKNRPAEMAGKWNGIGGKIEAGERAVDAMVREFKEETGVNSSPMVWQHFATLRDATYQIHAFVTIWPPEFLDLVRTVESEEVRVFDGDVLVRGDVTLMSNLRWLMPMALCLSETDIPVLIEYASRQTGV